MVLSFDEITNDKRFEDLVVSYFEELKRQNISNIIDVVVKPSGTGVDGGRDVLVTLQVSDSIVTFEKRWIIQCKFHNKDISTNKIADINIPTLLHSYKACGYLLICKEKPTSKLTDLFERLENNCIFQNKYIIWSGEQFKTKFLTNEVILKQYFPKYSAFLNKIKDSF